LSLSQSSSEQAANVQEPSPVGRVRAISWVALALAVVASPLPFINLIFPTLSFRASIWFLPVSLVPLALSIVAVAMKGSRTVPIVALVLSSVSAGIAAISFVVIFIALSVGLFK